MATVLKKVRKRRRRKMSEIAKKKGLQNQQDGNENPEDNEGRWELRVKKKKKKNVTGIAKKKEPENKGTAMRIKKITKGNGNRG